MSQIRANAFRLQISSNKYCINQRNLKTDHRPESDRARCPENNTDRERSRRLDVIQRLPRDQGIVRAQPINWPSKNYQDVSQKMFRAGSKKRSLCLSYREGVRSLESSHRSDNLISVLRLEPKNANSSRPYVHRQSRMIQRLMDLGLKDSHRPESLKMPSYMTTQVTNLREDFLAYLRRFPSKRNSNPFRLTLAKRKDAPSIDRLPKTSMVLDLNKNVAEACSLFLKNSSLKESVAEKSEKIRLLYERLDKRIAASGANKGRSNVLKNFKSLLNS